MDLQLLGSDEDQDFSRYRLAYVEAYLEMRTFGDAETIEEWTDGVGREMFGSNDEIYEPHAIGVRIMGSEANLFHFDGMQKNWCESLTNAVKGLLVENQLASPTSTVTLVDIRGDPIAAKPVEEISDGGDLLVKVDGKRLLDETRLARQIGLPLATPVSHAPNKDVLLEDHVYNMTDKIRELVLDSLAEVEDMVAAEKMICDEDAPANLIKPIAQLVKENYGHAASFGDLLNIHACQDAVEALSNKRISEDDFAMDIAGAVLDEVAQSMQVNNMTMSDYFTARQMEKSNLFSSISEEKKKGPAGSTARTIFGSQVRNHTEKIGQILQDFPTNRAMFQTIVDHALFGNQALEGKINVIIRKGCNKHRRCNKRSVYRHGGHGHKQKKHSDLHHVHRHGRKLREYKFTDPGHHALMHRKAHRLAQLPPAPGTMTVMENWHRGHAHHGAGEMENYSGGGGSFPHYGLHDTRYSQNQSVSQGSGANHVVEKERDRQYSAAYERAHHPDRREVAGLHKPTKHHHKDDKGKEEESDDDEEESRWRVNAPMMALHKPDSASKPPPLESAVASVSKPDVPIVVATTKSSSPDTVSVTVSKKNTTPESDLPPAAEMVHVVAPAAAISKSDEELIRATLRSADALEIRTITKVSRQTSPPQKAKTAPVVATSPAKLRDEPPSMVLFEKTSPTTPVSAATNTGGGYKVRERVVVATAAEKKTPSPSASPVVVVVAAAAPPRIVLPDLPVQKDVDNAITTDDIDLDSFLIPQASGIRV